MKAKELIYKFTEELDKIKHDPHPTTKYKVRAYVAVLKVLNDNFAANEEITSAMINDTNLTQHMKNKLILLSKKKIKPGSTIAKKMLHNEIKNILGIGDKKAKELIADGLKSVADLKKSKWLNQLNSDTKTILKLEPLRKIPHKEIQAIEPILRGFRGGKIILVGSYRRKQPYSRDIDVMLVSPKRDTLDKYLEYLGNKIPSVHVYSKGPDKMSLILVFDRHRKFKADVFRAKPDVQYSMLLYSTGSKNFNVKMRGRAKQYGYLLNQNGLFDKFNNRVVPTTGKELAYFKALDMKYLKPENRD